MPNVGNLLDRENERRKGIKVYNGIKFITTEENVFFGGDSQKKVEVSIEDDGIVYITSTSSNGYSLRRVVPTVLINMERLLCIAQGVKNELKEPIK